jgi:hypothetical protein
VIGAAPSVSIALASPGVPLDRLRDLVGCLAVGEMTDAVEEDAPGAAGSTSPAAGQAEKGGEFRHKLDTGSGSKRRPGSRHL